MPTDLEMAAALRSAAEFCLDPNSPKVHGTLCKGGILPWSEEATHWCAIGWVYKQLGDQMRVVDISRISTAFDARMYESAAGFLRRNAAHIEERIPVTPEVALPQEVPA